MSFKHEPLVHHVLWEGQEATGTVATSALFWLPSDSPFGNLQLKLLKLRERAVHINLRIDQAWSEWRGLTAGVAGGGQYEPLIIEEAMYSIRRMTDELLSIRWLLHEQQQCGVFPTKLAVESIDGALRRAGKLFEGHRDFLTFCNGASNAYKHSFLQSDLSLVGVNEPCVFASRLPGNDLGKTSEFYHASLNDIVAHFTSFLEDSLADLRAHGLRLKAASQ